MEYARIDVSPVRHCTRTSLCALRNIRFGLQARWDPGLDSPLATDVQGTMRGLESRFASAVGMCKAPNERRERQQGSFNVS